MNERLSDLDAPKTVVGSIVHAAAILRHLANAEVPAGVTSIAQALKISPSSCFNILRTLVAEDLVEFDALRKTYALGLGAAEIAGKALRRNEIVSVLKPRLDAFVEEHQVTASVWRVSRRDRLVLVEVFESDEETRIHLVAGQRLPLLAGAGGRCIAAFSGLSAKALKTHFRELRWQRTVDWETYQAQVAETRQRGWAMDVDLFMSGVTTVAAPIFAPDGKVRFCISATTFSGRLGPADLQGLGETLREVASGVTA